VRDGDPGALGARISRPDYGDAVSSAAIAIERVFDSQVKASAHLAVC